jgi:hypothetical protein
MRKLYQSRAKRTIIVIEKNGVQETLCFDSCIIDKKRGSWGSSFHTDDTDTQAAIEAHPYFKNGNIWTDDKEPEAKPEVVEKPRRTVRRASATEE